jgi:hypothetical protein
MIAVQGITDGGMSVYRTTDGHWGNQREAKAYSIQEAIQEASRFIDMCVCAVLIRADGTTSLNLVVEDCEAENELNNLGEGRDSWEVELITLARGEIAKAEEYAEQTLEKPEYQEVIANIEGYVLGLCYAIRRRRNMSAPR